MSHQLLTRITETPAGIIRVLTVRKSVEQPGPGVKDPHHYETRAGQRHRVPGQRPTFKLLAGNLHRVTDQVEKLAKVAKKLGLDPPQVVIERSEFKARPGNPDAVDEWVQIALSGDLNPKIAGHSFLGTIQHTEAGNILASSPYATTDIPEKYRAAPPVCEHCKTKRERKDTFVVHHEEMGDTKQVGRQCLKDYLGHTDAEATTKYLDGLIEVLDLLSESEGDGEGEAYGERPVTHWRPEWFLAYVVACAQKWGWTSKQKAVDEDRMSTAVAATEILLDKSKAQHKYDLKITDQDREDAKKMLSWIREQPESWANQGNFFYNLWTIAKADGVEYRHLGILAALYPVYRRAQEEKIKREKQAKDANVGPQGEVGEKITRQVTVTNVYPTEGYYGTTYITKMQDEHGNVYTWFASSDPGLEQGQSTFVTGTVKQHKEFRGTPETVLTRCKLTQEAPAAPKGSGKPKTPKKVLPEMHVADPANTARIAQNMREAKLGDRVRLEVESGGHMGGEISYMGITSAPQKSGHALHLLTDSGKVVNVFVEDMLDMVSTHIGEALEWLVAVPHKNVVTP